MSSVENDNYSKRNNHLKTELNMFHFGTRLSFETLRSIAQLPVTTLNVNVQS